MAELKPSHEKALALAALCGFKIALGPAFLRASRRADSTQAWTTAAMGEMLLDKLGVFPARYKPMLLVPHTLAGVWTARESLREDGEEADDPSVLAAAAVVAAGVSVTLPLVRILLQNGLRIPNYLVGLAEDYVALQLGSRATGMSMDEIKAVARESVQGVGAQLKPTLDQVVERFQPAVDQATESLRPTLDKVGIKV